MQSGPEKFRIFDCACHLGRPLPSPCSADQTKSRDMWQMVCGGGRLEVDEYDIYYILKINMPFSYVHFHCTQLGGAIRAGYQQNELQERLFLFFSFLMFSRFVVLSAT